ncbi:unnamed protein product [Prorocentrum cordatum]|uniref:Autophagy-related protein 2 n=1 Tax=Prorocentrum cordatum TaxID=2364126 RepID=A0ABN9U3D6_9DINO|nr:unnamed protein product [Polarella glacialis]
MAVPWDLLANLQGGLSSVPKIVENVSRIPSFAANRIEKAVFVVKTGVDMAAAIHGAASRAAERVSAGVANLSRGATSVAWSAGRTSEAIAGLPLSLSRVGVALVDVSGRPVRAAQLAGVLAAAAVEGLGRGAGGLQKRLGATAALPGRAARGVADGAAALGQAAAGTGRTVSGVADAVGQAAIPERLTEAARSAFIGSFMIGRRPAASRAAPGAELRGADPSPAAGSS